MGGRQEGGGIEVWLAVWDWALGEGYLDVERGERREESGDVMCIDRSGMRELIRL